MDTSKAPTLSNNQSQFMLIELTFQNTYQIQKKQADNGKHNTNAKRHHISPF